MLQMKVANLDLKERFLKTLNTANGFFEKRKGAGSPFSYAPPDAPGISTVLT